MTDTLTTEEQKNLIRNILLDFLNSEDCLPYLYHIGFDLGAVGHPSQFEAALLGHYRIGQGQYDVERAANDMATYPPMLNRIFEIMREKQADSAN